jgi:osmotically-inducible protein OsmY
MAIFPMHGPVISNHKETSMARDRWRDDRFEDESEWVHSRDRNPRTMWGDPREEDWRRYRAGERRPGYERSSGADYYRGSGGRYEQDDDESYFRRGRPEEGGRGYIGGDRNQGYVGFGDDQGFWRSSGSDADRRDRYGERYGRSYETSRYGSAGSGERGWWDRATDEVASWMGDEDAERRRKMDEARSHRGRGPRGYSRSDERIKDDLNDRLTDDHYVDASEIDVAVSGGEVTLSGTVRSRSDKRRAEDLAESISGVRHVQNNLRVTAQYGSWDQPPSAVTGAESGTAATKSTTTAAASRKSGSGI